MRRTKKSYETAEWRTKTPSSIVRGGCKRWQQSAEIEFSKDWHYQQNITSIYVKPVRNAHTKKKKFNFFFLFTFASVYYIYIRRRKHFIRFVSNCASLYLIHYRTTLSYNITLTIFYIRRQPPMPNKYYTWYECKVERIIYFIDHACASLMESVCFAVDWWIPNCIDFKLIPINLFPLYALFDFFFFYYNIRVSSIDFQCCISFGTNLAK